MGCLEVEWENYMCIDLRVFCLMRFDEGGDCKKLNRI